MWDLIDTEILGNHSVADVPLMLLRQMYPEDVSKYKGRIKFSFNPLSLLMVIDTLRSLDVLIWMDCFISL